MPLLFVWFSVPRDKLFSESPDKNVVQIHVHESTAAKNLMSLLDFKCQPWLFSHLVSQPSIDMVR